MNEQFQHHRTLKFLVMSAGFLFVGTVHGVLQVLRPVRAWLDAIGSPYGGPGHMIDPLAHAHINVVGGVVLMMMGVSYYLFPKITGKPIYSQRMVEHTFWWTTLGVAGFYSTLLIFGIWEGKLLLAGGDVEAAHVYYGPVISIAATVMGMGFWIYFINLYMSLRRAREKR